MMVHHKFGDVPDLYRNGSTIL